MPFPVLSHPFLPFLGSLIPIYAVQQTEVVDLNTVPTLGDPWLVASNSRLQIDWTGKEGKRKTKVATRLDVRLEFVDTFRSYEGPERFEATRLYLTSEIDENRKTPIDNELAGVSTRLVRSGEDLEVELVDRAARESLEDELVTLSSSASWPFVSGTLSVGDSLASEPLSLVALLGVPGAENAKAMLELVRVDQSGEAVLVGDLMAQATLGTGRIVCQGRCEVRFDTRAHHVTTVQWKANVRGELETEDLLLTGTGSLEATCSLSTGPPAAAALKRKPTYRDVPRSPALVPIDFTLPSHWYAVEGHESPAYRTSLHGATTLTTLNLFTFDAEGGTDAAIDAVFTELEETTRVQGRKNARCALGQGQSARFTTRTEDGTEVLALIELYPLEGKRLLVLRLTGTEAAIEGESGTWSRLRASLRARS